MGVRCTGSKPKVFAIFREKRLDRAVFLWFYGLMGLGNSIDFAL